MKSDPVDPKHYHAHDGSGIHCHQAQKAMVGTEGYNAYMIGCALKYMWRWKDKNGIEDLRKARRCLTMVLDSLENPNATPVPLPNAVHTNDSTQRKQGMAEGKTWFIYRSEVCCVDGQEHTEP